MTSMGVMGPQKLSREEQLRQWQEERRNKRDNGRSTLGQSRAASFGSNNRKVVRVKVRRSNPTPSRDNNDRNRNPSLRLYEQGTVASRMKSKTPISVDETPILKTSMLNKKHSSTIFRRSIESIPRQKRNENRRKSAPIHPIKPVLQENRIIRNQRASPTAFRSPSSNNQFNILVIEHKQKENEFMSPLSCSIRSSLFGSPPTRLPRHYNQTEPQVQGDVHKDMASLPYNGNVECESPPRRSDKYAIDTDGWKPKASNLENYFTEAADYDEPAKSNSSASEKQKSPHATQVTCRSSNTSIPPFSLQPEEKMHLDDHGWKPWASPSVTRSSPSIPLDQRSQLDANSPVLSEPKEVHSSSGSEEVGHKPGWADRLDKDSENETQKKQISERSPAQIHDTSGRRLDEEEIVFDWRNMLSPDPTLESSFGDKKQRTDASLLILPKPSPIENSIAESSAVNTRIDATEVGSSEGQYGFERDKYQGMHKVTSERESCDCSEENPSDSRSQSEDSNKNERGEWPFTNDQDEGTNNQKDALLEARCRSDEISTASTKKVEDQEVSNRSEKLKITQLLVDDFSQETGGADNEEENFLNIVPESVLRVGNKAVLEPIREDNLGLGNLKCKDSRRDSGGGEEATIRELRQRLEELQWQADCVCIEKTKLQNQIYTIRKKYENRVTPFRDLFEEMSNLRKENKELKIENEKTSATLQSTVVDLQLQMSEALGIALQKNAALAQDLAEARERLMELEDSEGNKRSATQEE